MADLKNLVSDFSKDLSRAGFGGHSGKSASPHAKAPNAPEPVDVDSLIVKCSECGTTATVAQVNSDEVRFFQEDGSMVRFGSNTTQAKLNALNLLCECCQDDKEEYDEHWD